MSAGDGMAVHLGRSGWITSSYSTGSGSCVEVGFADGAVLIRDSKDRRAGRPVIGLPSEGWANFLDTITDTP